MQEVDRMKKSLLRSSCRIAFAAFLHDLGKFAERARIDVSSERLEINKQLYCPHRKAHTDAKGRFTHIHAAYTGIAMDIIERHLPELIGQDAAPFAAWRSQDSDDSLINAAAMHHRPRTFLQWIVATADRVASGFDREEFEAYNESDEGTETGKNHYTARQLTLFEQIRIDTEGEKSHAVDAKSVYQYRYPLQALSPDSIFPRKTEQCEGNDNKTAQQEYRRLWEDFLEALKRIPESHRANWPLWLDHFETLWGTFTQAIPSATAFNVRPDVSLYDHSRVTAALAVSLWRYHHERGETGDEACNSLAEQGVSWEDQKFLLIQGDFFGIQDFIFASGESHKRAAKLLRGRSFYVSLLTECAALKVLDELALPSTSQVMNAAGKFMIVAPNTEQSLAILQRVRQELDAWFLKHSYGQAGIGLAWIEAACNDFRRKPVAGKSPYRVLLDRLFEAMEKIKYQRYRLCENPQAPIVFDGFSDQFDRDLGVCRIDGRSPAVAKDGDDPIGVLARDQIDIGNWLAKRERILITNQDPRITRGSLKLPIFGYYVTFVESQDERGMFGQEAKAGTLLRVWDFSLPKSETEPLWNGYARRAINAYIPRFDDQAIAEEKSGKYRGVDEEIERGEAKTLNHLACENRLSDDAGHWYGVSALTTLKGDVDNLGLIFQKGLGDEASFTKTAALSRQLNNFFAVYLPWLCRSESEYKHTYTVFAGGDDFFLVGPWLSQIKLAVAMRQAFRRYVAKNEEVHFSAGLSTTKPGLPIPQLGELAETALERAKAHNPQRQTPTPKNAVSCFNRHMFWDEFESLVMERTQALKAISEELNLSSGYIYGLLNLVDMAEKVGEKPENALWHSYFAYRTRRMLERNRKLGEAERKRYQQELAQEIAQRGIERHVGNYRVALFNYLYQQRD